MGIENLDVIAYTIGPVHASACARKEVPGEKVVAWVNQQYPTGIASDWALSDNKTFSGGEPNPCECDRDASRTHWLLNC